MRTIGILQADSIRPELAVEHGDYPAMFERMLASHGTRFETWCATKGELPAVPGAADAYVITGSRCSVYDELDWIAPLADCVNGLIDSGATVIGVCFGHQLIAHFRGGLVGPADVGWGVGVHRFNVTTPEPWMFPETTELAMLASHKDQVLELPDGAEHLAGSAFCPNSMYRIGSNVLCVQQHPEFTPRYAMDLMATRKELIDEAVYEVAMQSFGRPVSSGVFAAWVHNFIGVGE